MRVAPDLGLGSLAMRSAAGGRSGSSAQAGLPPGVTSGADIFPSATADLIVAVRSGGRQAGSPPAVSAAATLLLSRHRYTALMMMAARATATTTVTATIIMGHQLKPSTGGKGEVGGAGDGDGSGGEGEATDANAMVVGGRLKGGVEGAELGGGFDDGGC